MPNNSWERKLIGVAPNCGKEEFPEILGNKIYWCGLKWGFAHPPPPPRNKMPTFLGTRDIFPQAPWLGRGNSGQTQFWGPKWTSKSFSGVWDFRLCPFEDVSCCRGGGRQLQPQSSDLHNSCENHPAIMQVQQADLNVCMGNHFLFGQCPSTATGTPEKKTSESTGQGRGANFSIVPENSQIFGFGLEISLLKVKTIKSVSVSVVLIVIYSETIQECKRNGEFVGILDGQIRQSPIASVQWTRSTLAGHSAVPHGRNVNQWTPIARFESQHNERRVCED